MQEGGGIERAGGVKGVKGENGDSTTDSAEEEAMMGRMAILIVCRFERLLVEEQVSQPFLNDSSPRKTRLKQLDQSKIETTVYKGQRKLRCRGASE